MRKYKNVLNDFKRQLETKENAQRIILAKEGGKESYANRQVTKDIASLKKAIEDTNLKIEKTTNSLKDEQKVCIYYYYFIYLIDFVYRDNSFVVLNVFILSSLRLISIASIH